MLDAEVVVPRFDAAPDCVFEPQALKPTTAKLTAAVPANSRAVRHGCTRSPLDLPSQEHASCPIGHGPASGRSKRWTVSDRGGPPDPRLVRLGQQVRALRTDRSLTLEALAHDANVGVRQLARVEVGQASPSYIWLADLSRALGLSLSQLLQGLEDEVAD